MDSHAEKIGDNQFGAIPNVVSNYTCYKIELKSYLCEETLKAWQCYRLRDLTVTFVLTGKGHGDFEAVYPEKASPSCGCCS